MAGQMRSIKPLPAGRLARLASMPVKTASLEARLRAMLSELMPKQSRAATAVPATPRSGLPAVLENDDATDA